MSGMLAEQARQHRLKFSVEYLSLAVALCMLFCAAWAEGLLLPEASGDVVLQKSGTTVDASHADQGYIMVMQKPTDKNLRLRISLGKYNLTYDLNSDGEYEVFPLQLGNGKYKAQVVSQVSGKKYSIVSSISFKVQLENDLVPFLYPNQYVNYDQSTKAVAVANELCQSLSTDREKFDAVYQYVITHTVYDYVRAATVQNGYLPDLDQIYEENKGICFDFSALVACMMRSQGVPTKLMIGYADKTYHAWNEVWLDNEWVRYDTTSAVCNVTVKNYTTERYY